VKASESGSTLAMVSISSEPSKSPQRSDFIRLAITGEAGLLLLAWGLGRWLQTWPGGGAGPVLPALVWGSLAVLPLLLALRWMLTTGFDPIRRLVVSVQEQLGPLLVGVSPLQLGLLATVAGVSEELLFRGVIQTGLARWLSPLGGLLVASGLFGLVHFASRAYAAVAGVMGLYLGLLFTAQGSLLAPIVTHALYDWVALLWIARRTGSPKE
jgi:uncharacterized protein